jgi:hypothetical protein
VLEVLSFLLWLSSVGLFLAGVILALIRTHRVLGLTMASVSFFVWFLSIGMCTVATTPPRQSVDTAASAPSGSSAPSASKSSADAPPSGPRFDATVAPRKELPASPPLEASGAPASASVPRAPASALVPPAAPVRKPKPSKGKWTGGSDRPSQSPTDGAGTIAFSLNAENQISGALSSKAHRPRLIVRCRERKTDIYVDVGMPSQPDLTDYQRHAVRLRFDDGPPSSQLWSGSTDSESLFSPSAVALAKRLATSKRLGLEFTPFNREPEVIAFETAGFDQVIAQIAAPCGWKP